MKRFHASSLLAGLLLSVVVFTLGACATRTQPHAINPFFQKRDLAPEAFVELYNQPRYAWNRAEYLGIYQGYHYMAIYDSLEKSGTTRLRYYVRTPMDKLSPFFPSEMQKPIQSSPAPAAQQSETK